jgi:hypothetical protein
MSNSITSNYAASNVLRMQRLRSQLTQSGDGGEGSV